MKRRIVPELIRWGKRLRASIFRPTPEREVEEELDFHLEMRVRELRARGMDDAEARRTARSRFGDLASVRGEMERLAGEREARMTRTAWWEDLTRDVGLALRQLRRNPGFAAVAVATLTLGIGATTSVFSVVNGVLLEPLPYEEPDELVSLWTRYLPSTGVDIPQFPLSHPEVVDYRRASEAMEEVAVWYRTTVALESEGAAPEQIQVVAGGARLTGVLGVRPALGRDFSAEEHAPGAPPALLLSHRFWTDRFGADPAVLDRAVRVDGRTARVVGVLPEGADFPSASVDAWLPLGLDEADPGSRGAHWLLAVGRLADGASLATAEAELETITAAWYEEWEHHAAGHFVFLNPLRDDLVGRVRPMLLALLGAAGLVLLVACGNVANLFLVRAEARRRELAIRSSLGAGGGRLLRQLLAEAGVVTGLGAALGVLLAAWATPLILDMDPTAVPRAAAVGIDLTVLGFTLALVGVTTLAFGTAPLLRTGAAARLRGLAGGRDRVGQAGTSLVRRSLIGGEVAVGVMVVLAAGLVVQSFHALRSVDPGVEAGGVLTFRLSLPEARYGSAGEIVGFYEGLLDGIRALPGVTAAGAVNSLPLDGSGVRNDFIKEDGPAPAPDVPTTNAELGVVQPGYFGAMGIPLLRGRLPDASDGVKAPLVAVVDETAAERFWPGEDAVGKRFRYTSDDDGNPLWIRIVGVVGPVRRSLTEPAEPRIYLPHAQLATNRLGRGANLTVVARTAVPPTSVAGGARRVVAEADPSLPVAGLRTMEDVLAASVARERLAANLLGAFALLALVLSVVGIWGVVAYAVRRRTREIGIRIALGARRSRVVRMVVAEGATPALLGAALGVGLALLAAPWIQGLLYQVSPRDPATFVVLPAALVTVALLASWIPARRATRIAPSEALRTE